MEYTFSWSWFTAGIAIVIAGVLFVRFYQVIADNFGSGVSDYDKYKLYGVIAVGIGLASMVNLLPYLLVLLVNSFI